MSDKDTKPGAPSAEAVAEKAEHIEDIGSSVEKKLEAVEKKLEIPIKKAPGSVLKLLSDADSTVLRINKYGTLLSNMSQANNGVIGSSQRLADWHRSCLPSTTPYISSHTHKQSHLPSPLLLRGSSPLSEPPALLQNPAQLLLSMLAPSHLSPRLRS
jgi:hypothetical protein